MIYFTSDLHFSHKNILNMGRGKLFSSVEEMNQKLIENWNKKVTSNEDMVYVLGDVFWGQNSDQIRKVMEKLNGRKVLILGNHDRLTPNLKSDSWLEMVYYKEIDIDNKKIVLAHTPIFEWAGFYYGAYHFHGHTHGTLNLAQYTMQRERPNGNCWDVGVDNNNYEPLTFDEIKVKIENNIKNILDNK